MAGSLHSVLTSGVSIEGRLIMLEQILGGVGDLHLQGFCHRDLKPANILVQSYDPPICLISDFGMVSGEDEMTDETATIPYCAPEMWNEEGYNR
jgi:serine/threonine protein kinase